MKKISILFIVILGLNFSVYAQQTETISVFFDFNESKLLKAEIDKINSIESINSIETINLRGYSDSKGKALYNLKLSETRVEAVKIELENLYPKLNINSSYFGEAQNQDNKFDYKNPKNRRVDVFISYKKTTKQEQAIIEENVFIETIAEKVLYKTNTEINDILTQNLKVQKFEIENNKSSSLKTKDGIIISFKENSFKSNCDIVELELIEYNTKADMILGNMQTVSNGKLIYSFGMFDIKALCNGKEIELNENIDYTVLVPNKRENYLVNKNNKANLFYGERNETNQDVNWLIDGNEELNQIINPSNNRLKRDGKYCFLTRLFWKNKQAYQKKEIKKKLNKEDFENLKKVTLDDVAYFVLTPNKLGLINCDRFYDVPKDKIINQKVMIAGHSVNEVEMKIVFRDMKSVMNPTKNSQYFEFNKIEAGIQASVVAIKMNQQDGIEVAIRDIKTSSEKIELIFEKVNSLEELNILIKELDI